MEEQKELVYVMNTIFTAIFHFKILMHSNTVDFLNIVLLPRTNEVCFTVYTDHFILLFAYQSVISSYISVWVYKLYFLLLFLLVS